MIWIGVVSEIWKHINNFVFKGDMVDVLELFTLVQLKVWFWVTSKAPSVVSLILTGALILWFV